MTDNKVEAAVERARALLRGDFGAWDDDYVLDVLKGVISDRDRLAAEVERLTAESLHNYNDATQLGARLEAAEAKLSALVEIVKASGQRFREYEASHAAKGTQDADLKALRNRAMAERCDQALASLDRTAPGGPEPVVLFPEDGVEYGGLYVSEPAQEVAGLVDFADLESTLRMCEAGRGHNPGMISIPVEKFRAVLTAALSSSPSQGGETL